MKLEYVYPETAFEPEDDLEFIDRDEYPENPRQQLMLWGDHEPEKPF